MMNHTNGPNAAYTIDEVRDMPEKRKKPKAPRGQGEVILAIEDEEMLRDFLQTILGEDGYKVILAADGTEAVRTYMERMNEISLVLLDMGLPGMSGEKVLSSLVTSNPKAKVIAVSGSVEPEVMEGALQMGASAYLSKPYLSDELLTKVHHTLHGTPGPVGQF